MKSPPDGVTISLPNELINRIRPRVEQTEFDTVDEYVEFVMEEVLFHLEERQEGTEQPAIDEQKVEDRLKSLGYLNK